MIWIGWAQSSTSWTLDHAVESAESTHALCGVEIGQHGSRYSQRLRETPQVPCSKCYSAHKAIIEGPQYEFLNDAGEAGGT